MDEVSKTFAKSLKYWRTQRGLTQEALAECLGVTPHTVQSYEAGRREPDFQMLGRLASNLGVQPADLIRPEDESIPQAKRELLALIRGMDENEAAWALEALDVLLRGLRGQPLRPDQPSKKVKDR